MSFANTKTKSRKYLQKNFSKFYILQFAEGLNTMYETIVVNFMYNRNVILCVRTTKEAPDRS